MVLNLLISFTFISNLFCLGELTVREKKENHLLLAFIFFAGGYFFFHSYLMHSNYIHQYKFLLLTPTPILSLLGPISERYLRLTFEDYTISKSKFLIKFFPTLIVICLLFPFYFRDQQSDMILNEYGKIKIENIPLAVKCGVVLALSSLFYFCLSPLFGLLRNIELYRIFSDRKLRLFFLISIWIALLLPILAILTIIFDRSFAHVSVSIYCGTLLCFFYLLKQRNPDFFMEIQKKVIYEKKYKKSQLTKINLDLFKQKFNVLFQVDKVFLDENLSLGLLAKKLNVTEHKLSEYLALVEKKQFYQILAEYRVNEAKQKIKETKNSNLLEIAYGSGFSSKSNFNKVFKEITGFTPSAYKKASLSDDLDDSY